MAENELKYEMEFPVNDSMEVDLSMPPDALVSSDSVPGFSSDLRIEHNAIESQYKVIGNSEIQH